MENTTSAKSSIPTPLLHILTRDGFIIFISGKREQGKTDFSMLLSEICFKYNLRKYFATNIEVKSTCSKQLKDGTFEDMQLLKITNLPDLERWLQEKHGLKVFIFDELGKHYKRMRFMSEFNQKINEIIQLIRHYDGGLIGIAPSDKFIDSNFLNTDIIDAVIRKINKKTAVVSDFLNDDHYFLNNIRKTSIEYNSKDIAEFTLKKRVELSSLRKCCQAASIYAETKNMHTIMTLMKLDHPEMAKRLIIEHLKHTANSQLTSSVEVLAPTNQKP